MAREQVQEKKKIFFLGVTGENESDERAYSNFVYALCGEVIRNEKDKYDIGYFKRHDMLEEASNIRDSVYRCISESDAFIVLLDLYNTEKGSFNANVWFELGLASTQENKTIILITKESTKDIPFYVSDVYRIELNEKLIEWFEKHKEDFKNNKNVSDLVSNPYEFSLVTDTKIVFDEIKGKIKQQLSRTQKNPFDTINESTSIYALGGYSISETYKMIVSKLEQITKQTNIVEYIDGEDSAFKALTEAVKNAKKTLRTSRFANQSIVSSNKSNDIDRIHDAFMQAIYDASNRGVENIRIICNNNPEKWKDIYSYLKNCSNENASGKEAVIYIMRNDYSINFEFVIVDDSIAFLNFYQKSLDNTNDGEVDDGDTRIEKINSTLRINDPQVCKKLTKIYDRLIYISEKPLKYSTTVLGIKSENCEETDIGNFKSIKHEMDDNSARRTFFAKFITALNKWDITPEDRENMLIGLCLVSDLSIDMLKQVYKGENGEELAIKREGEDKICAKLKDIKGRSDQK